MGRIEVSGTNKKCIDDAMRMIKAIVAVPEVGEVYKGKVRSIMPVSYTHLDVYKRQGHTDVDFAAITAHYSFYIAGW